MRTTSTLFGLAIVASFSGLFACGGGEPPPPAPPPPPALAAETAPVASAAPPPTPPKPTMSDMQIATLKAVVAAMNAHDPKTVGARFASDATVKSAPNADLSGRDAIVAAWTQTFATIPDMRMGISRVLQKGNVAVITWAFSGTDSGTGMMGKPTKRAIGHDGSSVLWFSDDGLVKEAHEYADQSVTKAQLDPKARVGSFRALPTVSNAMVATVSSGGPDEDALLVTGNNLYAVEDTLKVKDMLPFFADDVTLNDFSSQVPIKGVKELAKEFGLHIKLFPDLHQMPVTKWAIGSYLVSEGILQGTHKGGMMGIPATNKPIATHVVDIVQWNVGKVQSVETYMNGIEMLTQLGLLKPADAGARP